MTNKGTGQVGATRGQELSSDVAVTLRQFRIVVNAIRNHFHAVERKAGVSGAQVWALSVVAGWPGINVRDLAGAMDIHQSTASNLLRGLIDKKLVVAERDRDDKRAVNLFATAQGRKVLAKAPTPYSGVLPKALMELDGATVRRLNRDLAKLVAVLSPRGEGALIPLGDPESDRSSRQSG